MIPNGVSKIIRHIFRPWLPYYIQNFPVNLICDPKKRISINRDLRFFTVPFAMLVAVLLSQWIGVFGCKWPISSNINQITFVSLPFMNNASNSASAVEATTNFKILHTMKIFPFNKIGFPSSGTSPIKYTPAILPLALGSDK